MTFEDQLKVLVYFHLQEHKSARHLVQDMQENDFAKQNIAPDEGISRSSFSKAINHRGLEQLQYVFENLYKQASAVLPNAYEELGDLVSIDGSLITAVLSMFWADYREGAKKAKAHCGFDINHGIPTQVYLTDGNGAERPFIDQILTEGQTGVMDRGYQSHDIFDLLQGKNKHFKFPSYPFEYMPWSKVTVVSTELVIMSCGLLPSVIIKTSAFPLLQVGLEFIQ